MKKILELECGHAAPYPEARFLSIEAKNDGLVLAQAHGDPLMVIPWPLVVAMCDEAKGMAERRNVRSILDGAPA